MFSVRYTLTYKVARDEAPTLVVTPNTAYSQIFRRETFLAESHSADKGN
jgi:hypothetical protein